MTICFQDDDGLFCSSKLQLVKNTLGAKHKCDTDILSCIIWDDKGGLKRIKKVGSEKVNHMQMKFFYCISLKTEDLL